MAFLSSHPLVVFACFTVRCLTKNACFRFGILLCNSDRFREILERRRFNTSLWPNVYDCRCMADLEWCAFLFVSGRCDLTCFSILSLARSETPRSVWWSISNFRTLITLKSSLMLERFLNFCKWVLPSAVCTKLVEISPTRTQPATTDCQFFSLLDRRVGWRNYFWCVCHNFECGENSRKSDGSLNDICSNGSTPSRGCLTVCKLSLSCRWWVRWLDSFLVSRQIRNTGSWIGNVFSAKTHPDFPSDILLLLTTVVRIYAVVWRC